MRKIMAAATLVSGLMTTNIALADDPLLTEDFFESPAAEDNSKDSEFGDEAEFVPPPEVQAEPAKPWFKGHSVSGGIGISSGYFALRATVRSFFNDYFAWENTGFYQREVGEYQGKEFSLEFYGFDTALMAQYQVVKLLTPFVGAGPGFEMWSQLYDEYEFDKSNSLNATMFVGTNINMTKNLILQLRHVTKYYLTDQPIKLSDRVTKEDNTQSFVQVYFMLSI